MLYRLLRKRMKIKTSIKVSMRKILMGRPIEMLLRSI